MHELPQDLTSSLRSYRGSVHGGRREIQPAEDGGHGTEEFDEKAYLEHHDGVAALDDINNNGVDLEKERFISADQRAAPRWSRSSFSSGSGGPHQGHPSERGNGAHGVHTTDWVDTTHSPAVQNGHSDGPTKTNGEPVKEPVPPTPATAKHSLFDGPKVTDPDPVAKRYANDQTPLTPDQFHELIGMLAPAPGSFAMPRNVRVCGGLYDKVVSVMLAKQIQYRLFSAVVYILLGVQLVLSAMFIVLGTIRSVDVHVPTAVLGAVATVVAGTLALMQGQGLPNRLRQTRDAMRNVAFLADELYEDFQAGKDVFFSDVRKVREEYLRVLEEARRNHPDTWTKAAEDIASGSGSRIGAGIMKKRHVTGTVADV